MESTSQADVSIFFVFVDIFQEQVAAIDMSSVATRFSHDATFQWNASFSALEIRWSRTVAVARPLFGAFVPIARR
jgi:hypothetical protein